jgi:hypothetical protein
MWYYNVNNQPTGPVDDAAIQVMVKSGTITPATLVWQEGMATWVAMGSTQLAAFLPAPMPAPAPAPIPQPVAPAYNAVPQAPAPGMPPQGQMAYPANTMGYAPAPTQAYYAAAPKPAAQQIKELNDLFMWFWICLIGMIITAGASGIASLVLFFIIVHRCWSLIQDGYARTTPGKAIGFLFIPFYSYYWVFPAMSGLAKDMNMYNRRRNLPIPPCNEGLATTFSVFWLLTCIPYVDFVTVIPWFVLWIIYTKNIKETAVATIQYTQR